MSCDDTLLPSRVAHLLYTLTACAPLEVAALGSAACARAQLATHSKNSPRVVHTAPPPRVHAEPLLAPTATGLVFCGAAHDGQAAASKGCTSAAAQRCLSTHLEGAMGVHAPTVALFAHAHQPTPPHARQKHTAAPQAACIHRPVPHPGQRNTHAHCTHCSSSNRHTPRHGAAHTHTHARACCYAAVGHQRPSRLSRASHSPVAAPPAPVLAAVSAAAALPAPRLPRALAAAPRPGAPPRAAALTAAPRPPARAALGRASRGKTRWPHPP
jgi:hypothetical protein